MKFSKEDLLALESQLSHPTGTKGVSVADNMATSNLSMITACFESLNIQDEETVLEIGHGNASHVQKILQKAKGVSFIGLEISKTMHKEALKNIASLKNNLDVTFELYNGVNFPFENNSFDKIASINTLYFWKQPKVILNELYRILKPKGKIALCYADKDFMETLPFVGSKFRLYDKEGILKLINSSPLQLASFKSFKETVKNKLGETVQRNYNVIVLNK